LKMTQLIPLDDGRTLYDISPVISENTAVFPGDEPFSRNTSLSFANKNHLTLSSIKTSVHIGAHTDAPNHYHSAGEGIESRSLNYYLGSCQVVEVQVAPGARIGLKDLGGKDIDASRVLFKTNSFPNPNQWNDDFNSLEPELITWMSQKGVKLVGIDTPSIDPVASKKLESHQRIYENNMAILEGIVLKHVPSGTYELVALPLSLKDADASPVRAVLIV